MKKLLIIFTFLLIFVVAAIVSVPFWLDVNKYKAEIVALINDNTGLNVKIEGDITARAVPDISLIVGNVSVSSPYDESVDLFTSEELVLNIKLAPIFEKQIEVDSLKLVKPSINVSIDKDGVGSWEVKKDTQAVKESDEVTEVSYTSQKSENIIESLKVNQIEITDASFNFVDHSTNQNLQIQKLNINTSVKPGENDFKVSGKLDIFPKNSSGNFDVRGKYLISGLSYKLKDIDITFDDIKAHSDIEVDMSYARPSLKVALYSNKIDINDYIDIADIYEENSNGGEEESKPSEPIIWSQDEFDFSVLNKADVNFNFKADGIKYQDYEIGEIALNTYLKNGRLTLNFKDVSVYEGVFNCETVIDGASGLPALKTKFDIKSLNIKDVLKVAGQKEIFTGTANFGGNIYSVGNSQKALIEKLSGKININVEDGVIEGVDILSMLNSKPNAFNIGLSKHNTKFQQISADLNITNGVIANDNLVLKSDVLNMEGYGEVDLPKQLISYKLTPKYSQDFENNDEPKPRIPVLISGNIFKPVFRLEVKTIVQDLINNPESGKNLVNQLKRDFKDIKKNFGSEEGIKNLKNLFQ